MACIYYVGYILLYLEFADFVPVIKRAAVIFKVKFLAIRQHKAAEK